MALPPFLSATPYSCSTLTSPAGLSGPFSVSIAADLVPSVAEATPAAPAVRFFLLGSGSG